MNRDDFTIKWMFTRTDAHENFGYQKQVNFVGDFGSRGAKSFQILPGSLDRPGSESPDLSVPYFLDHSQSG